MIRPISARSPAHSLPLVSDRIPNPKATDIPEIRFAGNFRITNNKEPYHKPMVHSPHERLKIFP
jgi:hypothetical protein